MQQSGCIGANEEKVDVDNFILVGKKKYFILARHSVPVQHFIVATPSVPVKLDVSVAHKT